MVQKNTFLDQSPEAKCGADGPERAKFEVKRPTKTDRKRKDGKSVPGGHLEGAGSRGEDPLGRACAAVSAQRATTRRVRIEGSHSCAARDEARPPPSSVVSTDAVGRESDQWWWEKGDGYMATAKDWIARGCDGSGRRSGNARKTNVGETGDAGLDVRKLMCSRPAECSADRMECVEISELAQRSELSPALRHTRADSSSKGKRLLGRRRETRKMQWNGRGQRQKCSRFEDAPRAQADGRDRERPETSLLSGPLLCSVRN
ncbi:hypothetical protein L1887_58416 [Cichorium endivia]|nr:hypothetical protein L1887_58416 [Cichorium endivia]